MYEGPSKKRLAFVRAKDSKSKKTIASPIPAGATTAGIKVKDISEGTLTVVQPDGKTLVIPLGKEKKIFLE
jgi:hypothetical protein